MSIKVIGKYNGAQFWIIEPTNEVKKKMANKLANKNR